jgi:hypothetical protein
MTAITGALHLNVQDGKIQLQRCALYAHRVPLLNHHHICPESWFLAAGKPVGTPMLYLCPDCHMACHCAIDGLLRGLDVSALPPRCVALARQAFELAEMNGLTPAPTL